MSLSGVEGALEKFERPPERRPVGRGVENFFIGAKSRYSAPRVNRILNHKGYVMKNQEGTA